ncbi:UNVERIFIED_CONTAM: hypothetical protein RMT77_005198 [Armadillidium vulgare]
MMTNETLSTAASILHNEALLQGLDSAVRHIGYNLPTAIGAVNIKAIGFIIALVFLGILLLDWLSYALSTANVNGVNGGDSSYSSYGHYGRSLLTTAADIWEQTNQVGRNGRTIESLGPMVGILDSIAVAIHKWDNSTASEDERDSVENKKVLS